MIATLLVHDSHFVVNHISGLGCLMALSLTKFKHTSTIKPVPEHKKFSACGMDTKNSCTTRIIFISESTNTSQKLRCEFLNTCKHHSKSVQHDVVKKNIKFHKICCKLLLQFEVLVTISAKRRCAYVAYVVASMQSCTTQLHSRNHGLPGGTIHRSARQLAKKHAITMCKNSTVNTAATIERIRYRKAEIQLVWSGTAGSLSSRS